MLTKNNFGSKYCRKEGDILNKQQILGDLRKQLNKVQKELYKYTEEPPYLKRQLAELEMKVEKRINQNK